MREHSASAPAAPPRGAGPVAALAAAGVGAGVAGVVAGSWWLAGEPVGRLWSVVRGGSRPAALTVQDVVLGAFGLALLACLAWLVVAVAVAVASWLAARRAPGGRLSESLARLCASTSPAVVRRGVALVLGATLSAGAGAAVASPVGPGGGRLDGLPLPDRVTGAGTVSVAPVIVLRAGIGAEEQRHVTVRRGDSLWSIAARVLGPGASDAEVVRAWHRIAARNAARLGPDPDLILPGTRLDLPRLRSRT